MGTRLQPGSIASSWESIHDLQAVHHSFGERESSLTRSVTSRELHQVTFGRFSIPRGTPVEHPCSQSVTNVRKARARRISHANRGITDSRTNTPFLRERSNVSTFADSPRMRQTGSSLSPMQLSGRFHARRVVFAVECSTVLGPGVLRGVGIPKWPPRRLAKGNLCQIRDSIE